MINTFLFECVEDNTQIRVLIEDDDMYIYGPTGLITTKCHTLMKHVPWELDYYTYCYLNTEIRFLIHDSIYITSMQKRYSLVEKKQNKKFKDTTADIFEQHILQYIKTD